MPAELIKSPVSEENLALLSGFVAGRMGLNFPRERWADLARSAVRAAAEFKFDDAEVFINWLPGAALDPEHMEILASHLTVNETYFWRETAVFDALTGTILPELARRHGAEKRLRLWSAGCSTGEEAYSLAIALHRAIPGLKDWNITILATDISARVLRKGAEGVYGAWSFRNTPDWLRENYFTRVADKQYAIDPAIKKLVTFSYLNLAQDVYPSPVNNTSAMDIIFCRNVLMYFIPDLMRQVIGGLYSSLAEGGYAAVSSSELSQVLFPQFRTVNFPGAIIYKKDGLAAPLQEQKPVPCFFQAGPPAETALKVTPPVIFQISPPKPVILPAANQTEETAEVPVAVSVRLLANQGKLDEALALCDKTVARERLDPVLYYLRALILVELNKDAEAAASLRKALYLSQDMVVARFTLGKTLLKQGDAEAANKEFRNVRALLDKMKSGDILPESDGLNAARFREMIDITMQTEVPS